MTDEFTKCEDCKKFSGYLEEGTWQCTLSHCIHHSETGDYFEPKESVKK